MMIADRTGNLSADGRLIESGMRSSLLTLEKMLPQGMLLPGRQDFIHSSAARLYLKQLRCEAIEIVLSLTGRFSGAFALVLDYKAAEHLVTALTGEGTTMPDLSKMARSALEESGNIVASAFLGALESMSGSGGLPGLPLLREDVPHREEISEHGLYALSMTLIVGNDRACDARGGLFISLADDSCPATPALGK